MRHRRYILYFKDITCCHDTFKTPCRAYRCDCEPQFGHPSALTACIRPENLSFTGRKSHKFSATIWTIDFLGATTNVNVKTSDGQLVSVTVFGPSSYDVGAQVEVYYDPKDVFLFDAAGARVIP